MGNKQAGGGAVEISGYSPAYWNATAVTSTQAASVRQHSNAVSARSSPNTAANGDDAGIVSRAYAVNLGKTAADSHASTLMRNGNASEAKSRQNGGEHTKKQTKPKSPRPQAAAARPSGKTQRHFLTQLFSKSPNTVIDESLNDQKPIAGGIPIGETPMLLKDRPALRLDSRLVCKYEVLSVIGKGSFSQVLRVQDRLTRKFYAVKLVSTDSDFGAVNNELSILSRVQHPFVIRLEEVFRGVSKLFIVMEMASGGEMYDRVVTKGRYTEAEARQAVRMLLTGLEYLHGIHITHRDLKPENLLYSDERPEARLLITDFGLAHQSKNAEEKMFETCGTPEYIAPEILLRVPYSNKVDMWAVGVIAYILMSGIMPFDDDNRSRLYSHIITADYVYYPMFWAGSELAKQFVDDLLDTNAEQRLSAKEALKNDWVLGEQKAQFNVSIRSRQRHPSSSERSMQRTKSTRSIRSVTRSDHGHRVDPREVDKLANDLEKLAKSRHRAENAISEHRTHHHGTVNPNSKEQQYRKKHNDTFPSPTTKHYGMI